MEGPPPFEPLEEAPYPRANCLVGDEGESVVFRGGVRCSSAHGFVGLLGEVGGGVHSGFKTANSFSN